MRKQAQVRTYDRTESVVFLKTREAFGGLSNMAPGFPLLVNGVQIRTSEALYQACRFPHKPEIQRVIINEPSPMAAKICSKSHRLDSRGDWNTVRVKIMRWCLRVKLARNWDKFGELLKETGDRAIVEWSHKDDFWGAKPNYDGTSLTGINLLGRLLMELREQLNSDDAMGLRSVKPLEIPQFSLFEESITEVASPITIGKSGATDPRPRSPDAIYEESFLSSVPGGIEDGNGSMGTEVGAERVSPPAAEGFGSINPPTPVSTVSNFHGVLPLFRGDGMTEESPKMADSIQAGTTKYRKRGAGG